MCKCVGVGVQMCGCGCACGCWCAMRGFWCRCAVCACGCWCAMCVRVGVGVQCVGVGVGVQCAGVGVGVQCVTLTPTPIPSPRVSIQNAHHVCIQNVSVCTGTTSTCVNTCGRVAGTHGDVLNVRTERRFQSTLGVFSVPHQTHRTPHTPQTKNTHTHQTHTTTMRVGREQQVRNSFDHAMNSASGSLSKGSFWGFSQWRSPVGQGSSVKPIHRVQMFLRQL